MPAIDRLRAGCAALALFIAPACVGNFTPVQRVQDAANDLTTATRFGRMDIAAAHVSRAGRDSFARQHAAWGNRVSIVDSEVVGLRLRDKDHADVTVTVSWQRVDESEMRTTLLVEHWCDHQGAWLLETEERSSGDVGLLGEATTSMPPSTGAVQFETITIR